MSSSSGLGAVELPALAAAATAARQRAYVPYSGFDAAAAVLGRDGAVYVGVVIENISLGLAMCAERAAMFAAVTGGTQPRALVLVAPPTDGGLTMPCGACLQVALELGGPSMAIGSADGDRIVQAAVGELLPRGPHRS